MDILIGERFVLGALKNINPSTILFQSKNIVVSSENEPKVREKNHSGGQLIIWGQIYAIINGNGGIEKLRNNKDLGKRLLKLFDNLPLENAICQIEGRFLGLVINDENSLIVFGDSLNRMDLFYYKSDHGLIASSSLEAIMQHKVNLNTYHQASLAHLLSVYGNSAPKKHTIYEGIKRLGVGERLEFTGERIENKTIPFAPTSVGNYDDNHLNMHSEYMHSAIDIRSSDENNWVFLSSGWDSSSILALLVKQKTKSKVKALTVRVRYSEKTGVCNQFEIDRAQEIADYFSVPLNIFDLDYTREEYLEYWNAIRLSLRSNHLYALNCYNYMQYAKFVKQNGSSKDAVFNGDISDGAYNLGFSQFATVREHPDLNFREYSDKMASYLFGPTFFSRLLKRTFNNDFVYDALRSRMKGVVFDDPSKMDQTTLKVRYLESFFLSARRFPFVSLDNSKLLTKDGIESYRAMMYDSYFKDIANILSPENIYACILQLYNSFHWQGGTVKGRTHASDHYQVDVSMPFWDSRIQSFLSAMPESWGRGLDLNPTKYPLKWMLKNKVDYPLHLQVGPHSYLYDIDPSWSADADILYGSAGKPYFKELIEDYKYEEIMSESHFNLQYLRKLTDDYCKDKVVTGQERTDLRNLISLCMVGWY